MPHRCARRARAAGGCTGVPPNLLAAPPLCADAACFQRVSAFDAAAAWCFEVSDLVACPLLYQEFAYLGVIGYRRCGVVDGKCSKVGQRLVDKPKEC